MRQQNGFTLVEISIGLVIIGLLIGGVMVGKDLLEGSNRIKLMGQISQFNTLMNAFNLRFNALPGDMENAVQFWGSVSGN